jgi:hypothetical protein
METWTEHGFILIFRMCALDAAEADESNSASDTWAMHQVIFIEHFMYI